MPLFHLNGNHNPKIAQKGSGLSFTFRLSETLIAVVLGSSISFGSGIAITNSQYQMQITNCNLRQLQDKPIMPVDKPSLRKD